ncbi:hypothetical protein J437_LFUL016689 [Ladona fulva]|uniref:N(6)-L-threonylcarbamoyladenine synthase n=1 Tax=Ladona fulva TaxID=123851 RepID=A0A8K0KQN2_LADFU|nr:hypothetical protein J437_LFUL016689 [Ladona fulva]
MSQFVLSLRNSLQRASRHFSAVRNSIVLGIETSCDDTGCAVVDSEGNILGESLHSQQQIHINHGGIIPPIAKDLHQEHIDRVVKNAIARSKVQIEDIDAIATTVKPGLPLSLLVGMRYGKNLAKEYKKPFIPIHHMEAHALTIRMIDKVDFPFLVMLLSGGHCLLNLVKDVDKFFLLGQSIDDAPGEAFDKFARRLKLHYIPEFSSMSGGRAVETAALRGNPLAFHFPLPLAHYKDCNFSFSGLKNAANKHILRLERNHGCFKQVCDECGYQLYAPPPHLCTDNGAMIAWNGMERWKAGLGIIQPHSPELDELDIQSRCMLGEDLRDDVAKEAIKCKWVKLSQGIF